MVDLSKVSDGALIPSTIATMLALPGVGSATHLAMCWPRGVCPGSRQLRARRRVRADVARAIVAECPDVRIIVTGADPLGVEGEAVLV